MGEEIHVILNPEAGGGAGRRARAGLERRLQARGLAYRLFETERPRHAWELARSAASAGARAVLVAGGDGTVHEVANGLLQHRNEHGELTTALAVYPVGTGNDFVKMLFSPRDPGLACDLLVSGELRHFDAGKVIWHGESEYFVNAVGTGVDVEVVRQIQKLPRFRGVLGYLIGLVRAVFGFRPLQLRVSVDGESSDHNLMMIAATNGTCLGGGFFVCPGALPDDGRFDICMVRELNFFQIAYVIPHVLRGTHTRLPSVISCQAGVIQIDALSESPLYFQLDGELREPHAARSVLIELERGVLPVIAAPRAGPGASTTLEVSRSPKPVA